jgi:hypothetical protein
MPSLGHQLQANTKQAATSLHFTAARLRSKATELRTSRANG